MPMICVWYAYDMPGRYVTEICMKLYDTSAKRSCTVKDRGHRTQQNLNWNRHGAQHIKGGGDTAHPNWGYLVRCWNWNWGGTPHKIRRQAWLGVPHPDIQVELDWSLIIQLGQGNTEASWNLLRLLDKAKCGKGTELHWRGGGTLHTKSVCWYGGTAHTF